MFQLLPDVTRNDRLIQIVSPLCGLVHVAAENLKILKFYFELFKTVFSVN
jgi:hypothetical protein